jgi:hypothetical protein
LAIDDAWFPCSHASNGCAHPVFVLSGFGTGRGGPKKQPAAVQLRLLPTLASVVASAFSVEPLQDSTRDFVGCAKPGTMIGNETASSPQPK